jgi:hypothetical protein
MDFYKNVIYKQKNTIAKYHPCKSNGKEINTIIAKYKQCYGKVDLLKPTR